MAVQMSIKGTAPTHIKEISDAATEYVDARDKHASSSTFLKRRRSELVASMQKHKLKQYADRGLHLEVTCETDTTLKVREPKDAKPKAAKKKGRRS